MTNEKLTDLNEVMSVEDTDIVYLVDISDTTDDVTGSSKKVQLSTLKSYTIGTNINLNSNENDGFIINDSTGSIQRGRLSQNNTGGYLVLKNSSIVDTVFLNPEGTSFIKGGTLEIEDWIDIDSTASKGIRLFRNGTQIGRLDTSNNELFIVVDGSRNMNFFVNGSIRMTIKPTGVVNVQNMPTSSTGLVSGDLWNDGGTVKIIP